MTKIIGDGTRLKSSGKWLVFHLLGTFLLISGCLALFFPSLLLNIFNQNFVDLLSFFAMPLIIIGVFLEVFGTVLKIKQHKLQNAMGSLSENASSLSNFKTKSRDNSTVNEINFDDTVDWSPLKGGGTNFKTHQLKEFEDGRLCFVAAPQLILFAGAFSGMGAVLGGVFLFAAGEIFPALFGLLFVAIGFAIYYFLSTPRVFDTSNGYYWKGKKQLFSRAELDNQKDVVALKDIKALQIVKEYVRGDKSSYYSYELNIIKQDNQRVNVVDHGSRAIIEQDAKVISDRLNIHLIARPE